MSRETAIRRFLAVSQNSFHSVANSFSGLLESSRRNLLPRSLVVQPRILTLSFLCSLWSAVSFAEDDILVADFENETYGNWKVEGKAFGPGPAMGTLSGQMPVSG